MVRCEKNNFQIFLLFAIEIATFSIFWQKKGLSLLEVNNPKEVDFELRRLVELGLGT